MFKVRICSALIIKAYFRLTFQHATHTVSAVCSTVCAFSEFMEYPGDLPHVQHTTHTEWNTAMPPISNVMNELEIKSAVICNNYFDSLFEQTDKPYNILHHIYL